MGNTNNSTKDSSRVKEQPLPESTHGTALNVNKLDLNELDREDFENLVDILFVVDSTGSMNSYIQGSIMTICDIVEQFKNQEYDLKFSLCDYRDHPPQETTYVTHFEDLCSGQDIVQKLKKISAVGGGDECEAVMDGLRDGLKKTSWRKTVDNKPSQRFLFHVCDAPPHGKEYGGQSYDKSWSKKGCPCGTKKEDIRDLLKKSEVKYFLIKPCEGISKMESIFRKTFKENYGDTINTINKGGNYPKVYEVEEKIPTSIGACCPATCDVVNTAEIKYEEQDIQISKLQEVDQENYLISNDECNNNNNNNNNELENQCLERLRVPCKMEKKSIQSLPQTRTKEQAMMSQGIIESINKNIFSKKRS